MTGRATAERLAPPARARHQVVSEDSPLSALQQRLMYMDRFPERAFVNVIENVPQWPVAEGAPGSTWAHVRNYGSSRGQGALLERLAAREARLHGAAVTPEALLVTNGALHALSILFRRLHVPGAVALCQAPVLGAIPEMLRSHGYRVVFFHTPGGEVDAERLRELCPERLRLIYVNTPNNPSGDILSPEALVQLLSLAREQAGALVADLVYDSYAFDGARVTSPLSLSGDWRDVYTVNSMSKNFGSPGLRIGWIASAPQNTQSLSGLLELETICVCGPAQDLAGQLLERGNAALVDGVSRGRRLLAERLPTLEGVGFTTPAGGTQLFVELPVTDVEDFCDFALSELGLGLVSASNYEGVEGAFVRLPMGAPPPTLDKALRLLSSGLAAYRD